MTQDRKAQMIELREQGLSYAQMAQEIGLSKSRVATLAKEYLPPKLRKRIRWTHNANTHKARILHLKAQGMDNSPIAKEIGCPRHHVRYVLRQARAEKYARDHTKCTRCTFLDDERNPIGEDGLCLYCRLQIAGTNLLDYHESGAALKDTIRRQTNMKTGLLWQDNTKTRTLEEKIAQATTAYTKKFHCAPNTCYIHPSHVNGVNKVGPVQVKALHTVLPHYFWIGEEDTQ